MAESVNLYKQLGVLVLMVALLFQSFQRTLIISDYYINTNNYAANCENKANIKMHCNGKCQMMKKLKQEEEKNKKNPERKAENNKEIVYYPENLFRLIAVSTTAPEKNYGVPLVLPETTRPHTIFHPPIAGIRA